MFKRYKKSLTAAAVALSVAAMSASVYADDDYQMLAVNKVEGSLSVMVLGSGGPQIQDSGRASAGYLIFADGQPYAIMDAGSGTFKSLGMSGAHIGQVNTILLSHMHIDHTADLPGIIKGIYFDGQLQGQQHTADFDIYGPAGRPEGALFPANLPDSGNPPPYHAASPAFPSVQEFMDSMFAQHTGNFTYLRTFVGGVDGGMPIIGHFGYAAHNLSPVFAPDPVTHEPAPINTIVDSTMADGSVLTIKEVAVNHFEAPAVAYRIDYKGHSVVYTGDTNSATNNIVRLAQGADMLVYDTSILDTVPPTQSPFHKRHTTPARIGEVAAAAGVKTLVLSHLTPISVPNIAAIIAEIQAQGFTGRIRVANDLKVYNLGDDD